MVDRPGALVPYRGGIAVAPLGPVHRLPDVPLAEPGATAVAEGQLPVIFCRRGPDGVAVCEPGRRAGEIRPGVELVVGVRVAIDVDVLDEMEVERIGVAHPGTGVQAGVEHLLGHGFPAARRPPGYGPGPPRAEDPEVRIAGAPQVGGDGPPGRSQRRRV